MVRYLQRFQASVNGSSNAHCSPVHVFTHASSLHTSKNDKPLDMHMTWHGQTSSRQIQKTAASDNHVHSALLVSWNSHE
eukprot:4522391-Amphidinium_carterae.2